MRTSSPMLLAAAVFMCALAVVRPHVTQRWALYLGTSADRAHAVLFLDPFPSDATCETRVKVFAANAERAFCASRGELQFGGGEDAVLAADFNPLWPASWWCRPRNPFPAKRIERRVART